MELLVIGAGPVGRALARACSAAGHTVTVARLSTDAGPRPAWLGADVQDAPDGVARVWFTPALGRGLGRRLAFRVLTDSPGL